MLAVHLVARLRSNRIDLRRPETAPVLWKALRSRFPEALINEVMPDHLHLLTLDRDPEEARAKLANACGRVQYALDWPQRSWEPVPEPRVVTKLGELRIQYRYIGLNECRAGFARDPLEALWSMYREVFGAVADPWVDRDRVLRRLGAPRRDPLAWLHAFVSGDPTVEVAGTPLPRAADVGPIATVTLGDVIRAAAAALHCLPEAIRRRGEARRVFVGLAMRVGWRDRAVLAAACGVTPDRIHRLAKQADPRAVEAALVCLGDPRLHLRTPPISTVSPSNAAKRRR
jgi:hypothetical protein